MLLSNLRNLERRGSEKLLYTHLAIDQPLLERILGQGFDLRRVLVHAVLPEVPAHRGHGLLGLGFQPRQRHHQRIDVEEVDHRQLLGFAERLVDADRQPWVLLDEGFTDSHQVHDREKAGLLKVGLLRLARVREQARDVRLAGKERRRRARREQGIELAGLEHADQRLVRTDRLQVEAPDRLERRALLPSRLLLSAAAPVDVRGKDAVFVLHHPPHPDHGGDLILGQADAFALEIRRGPDARVGADVDAGMAKNAGYEGGNADVGAGAGGDRPDVAGERELRDVEFLEAERAVENLLRIKRQIGDRAAFHLDTTIQDGSRAVIVSARDRYRHIDHHASLSSVLPSFSSVKHYAPPALRASAKV